MQSRHICEKTYLILDDKIPRVLLVVLVCDELFSIGEKAIIVDVDVMNDTIDVLSVFFDGLGNFCFLYLTVRPVRKSGFGIITPASATCDMVA